MRNQYKIMHQGGFTLIEMAVVVFIIGIIGFTAFDGIEAMIRWNSKVQTEGRLKDIRNAIEAAYRDHATLIDSNAVAELDFNLASVPQVKMLNQVPIAGQRCAATSANFAGIASYSSMSTNAIAVDGFGVPWCVFVNPQATATINGQQVKYHSVAIVSGGINGVIDIGTKLDAAGNLVLAGDDTGVLFDGRNFAQSALAQTMTALQRATASLEQYYLARYQSDPSRSIAIDYFSCADTSCPTASTNWPRWDANNQLLPTGAPAPGSLSGGVCAPVAMWTGAAGLVDPAAVLGLSKDDVTDGFGNILMFDNCSNAVRSPNNNLTPAMSIAPYTSQVSTTLPGPTPTVISATAVGSI